MPRQQILTNFRSISVALFLDEDTSPISLSGRDIKKLECWNGGEYKGVYIHFLIIGCSRGLFFLNQTTLDMLNTLPWDTGAHKASKSAISLKIFEDDASQQNM